MLEWRPRLIALLVLVVMLAVSLSTGYALLGPENWEW